MHSLRKSVMLSLCSLFVLATVGAGASPGLQAWPWQAAGAGAAYQAGIASPAVASQAAQQPPAPPCARAPAAVERQHLPLTNSRFELAEAQNAPAGWSVDASLPSRVQTASISRARALSGRASLRLENPEGSSVLVRSQPIATPPNVRHHAAVSILNELGTGWFYIEFWDRSGTRIDYTYVASSNDSDWQRVTLNAVSPADAISTTVAFYGSVRRANIAYFDDVSLTREPASTSAQAATGHSQPFHFASGESISWTENIETVVHTATKQAEPVLVPKLSWESNNVYVYGTVLYDTDECLFKMWYISMRPTPRTMYATSVDGLNWDKPALNVVTFEGVSETNIVGNMVGPVSVIKDSHDPDPTRRYKMMATLPGTILQGVYFSRDGIRWRAFAGNPVLEGGDVATVFYDTRSAQYVALGRVRLGNDPLGPRAVGISYSPDFETWSEELVVLSAGKVDLRTFNPGYSRVDIYGMAIMPYGQSYVGFPWMFYYERTAGRADAGVIDVRFATSTDLETWTRLHGNLAIERGPQGSFDAAMLVTANHPIVVGDEIWLYYGGLDQLHGRGGRAAIGLAKWRLDGFVSLKATGEAPGIVETVPLVIAGNLLAVNAAGAGSLRVELIDRAGEPIAHNGSHQSDPFAGDAVMHHVTWRGSSDLSHLAGQTVRLRFYLDGVELYAFRFADRPERTIRWGPR